MEIDQFNVPKKFPADAGERFWRIPSAYGIFTKAADMPAYGTSSRTFKTLAHYYESIMKTSGGMVTSHIGYDYVFQGDAGPYSEKDHTYPVNYYGKTKQHALSRMVVLPH